MSDIRVTIACPVECAVGETPIVDATTGWVHWLDIVHSALLSYDPITTEYTSTFLEEPQSALMQKSNGDFVSVGENTVSQIDISTGQLKPYATIKHRYENCRLNDARMDAQGRVWTGSMSKGLRPNNGFLYRVDPDGSVCELASGFGVANGLDWSPDGKLLYVVDTLSRTLTVFDCDLVSGVIRNPRVLADFLGILGKPDGITVGKNGNIWVAMWGGASIVELEPSGVLKQSISLPALQPSSLNFSNEGRALYVSTSCLRMDGEILKNFPGSGSLLHVDLGNCSASS